MIDGDDGEGQVPLRIGIVGDHVLGAALASRNGERIGVSHRRLIGWIGIGVAPAASAESVWKPQVVAAMTSLGWSEKDATGSIDKALADSPDLADQGNVAEILRTTLRWLGQDGARAGNRVGSRG